ncbi:polyphosphate kinase [Methanomicrobium sp. W14]|uniref:polyphosphate kinase 1 n=1 Tax=Methanomicrobium sp. W14 TaxID=2817839 RepID=UPI001AEA5F65|nr:polyphosphate kinase 1 [Methanomicrobium sp. W14]MBP2132736.1 polyphosphate kinase [Methanomicrobium sp. W14]
MPTEDSGDNKLFINRELSWIEFNLRVLEEAKNENHPLLERIKFLSIFSSNLDEFMMIRVSGLRRQIKGGVLESPPDGLTPTEQLTEIRKEVKLQIREADTLWRDTLVELLSEEKINIHKYKDLSKKQKNCMREYFEKEVFPALTPMSFDVGRPFPFISNLSLNLAVIINDPDAGMIFSRVKVPRDAFRRLIQVPPENVHCHGLDKNGKEFNFVFIEDLIASNVDLLFPGMDVVNCYPFVVTRDADIEIEEDEASDLLTAIEESVGLRRTGLPTRLEVNRSMPKWVRIILAQKLSLSSTDVYTNDDPLKKSDLMEFMDIDRPDLKDKPYLPFYPCGFEDENKDIFQTIKNGDILFYHPYDSFNPVINLLKQAADDPDVIAIKQTLYRVGKNSPVVKYLMRARENGKQVSVMVELKARFDEENNIEWAKKLEQSGVHVVYGIVGIKVHAKLCMIVRREKEGMTTYVHFGTGNYNPITARVYTDFGIMTCDSAIGCDAADLFNALTGHSGKIKYDSLLVSFGKTGTMREEIIGYIQNEINNQNINGNGYIALKMNQLVDPYVIKALYDASQNGVKVDLQVRGICSLRPGIPGVSDNIKCTSIVGRFLEHTRLYMFGNNGDPVLLTGSADMMPRNLNRRVEILVPVKDNNIKKDLIKILNIHFADNVNSRMLLSDGTYVRVNRNDDKPCDSQKWMIEHRGEWNENHP